VERREGKRVPKFGTSRKRGRGGGDFHGEGPTWGSKAPILGLKQGGGERNWVSVVNTEKRSFWHLRREKDLFSGGEGGREGGKVGCV